MENFFKIMVRNFHVKIHNNKKKEPALRRFLIA